MNPPTPISRAPTTTLATSHQGHEEPTRNSDLIAPPVMRQSNVCALRLRCLTCQLGVTLSRSNMFYSKSHIELRAVSICNKACIIIHIDEGYLTCQAHLWRHTNQMSTNPVDLTTNNLVTPGCDIDVFKTTATFLMCPPTLYDVNYVINPWMVGNVHPSSRTRAAEQWQHLYEAVSEIANV